MVALVTHLIMWTDSVPAAGPQYACLGSFPLTASPFCERCRPLNLLRTKSIEQSIADSDEKGRRLKRSLNTWDLMIMGVAVAVGAGIFSGAGPTWAAGRSVHPLGHAPRCPSRPDHPHQRP